MSNFLINNPNAALVDLSNYGIKISNDVEMIKTSLEDFFSNGIDEPRFVAQYSKMSKIFVCICEVGVKSRIAAKILEEEGEVSYYVGGEMI